MGLPGRCDLEHAKRADKLFAIPVLFMTHGAKMVGPVSI
jgi:hypothetical protein